LILGLAVPLWLDGFLKSAPIYQSPRMSAISVAATTGGPESGGAGIGSGSDGQVAGERLSAAICG